MWPACFVFNAIPALVCLVLFPWCPESPRFLLIKKNDEDGAKKGMEIANLAPHGSRPMTV